MTILFGHAIEPIIAFEKLSSRLDASGSVAPFGASDEGITNPGLATLALGFIPSALRASKPKLLSNDSITINGFPRVPGHLTPR
jgi:hypothetical protein